MAVAASVIHVSQMTAADGFVIMGDSAGDWAGVSVSDAGDVNGDGLDDVIIGAVAGSQGGLYSGQAYVIFGAPGKDRAQVHLSALGSQEGFILQGANANDFTGRQVSSAGDINGDGVDDLIISAVGVDFSGLEAGASYVPQLLQLRFLSLQQPQPCPHGVTGRGIAAFGDLLLDEPNEMVTQGYRRIARHLKTPLPNFGIT